MPVNEDRATNGKGHLIIIIMRVFDIRRRQEWKQKGRFPIRGEVGRKDV
jgi:hypothetical protein